MIQISLFIAGAAIAFAVGYSLGVHTILNDLKKIRRDLITTTEIDKAVDEIIEEGIE